MSEQRNLFIAVLLSMIVVFGWQYLVVAPRMQEEQARQAEVQAEQQAQQAVPGAAGSAAPEKPLPRAEAIAQSGTRAEIATPKVGGSINLTGGRFDDLRLRTYHETPDPKSPEIELLSPLNAEHPYFAEYGWVAAQGANQAAPGPDTKWTLAQGGTLSPGNDVELTYDNGTGLTFTRHISVDANYMFTIVDSVDNHGEQPVMLSPYALVQRASPPVTQKFWVLHEGYIGVFNGTLNDPTYDTLAKNNDTQKFESQGGWLGITDKYWMAAVIPPQSEKLTATYKAFDRNGGKAYQADYVLPERAVSPHGSQTVIHHLFAGAKVVDLVNNYRDQLGIKLFDYAVDWGWFWFLTRPIFIALDILYRYVGNFGVAILIFTVLVKLLFFPLANTSYRAMSKMKKLQPEMEKMRERFKEDKAQQQQELMKLYQKEKVNPLAGCLPMLIQIPVFFSLYKVLVVTIDMRHAPFFGWIRDLSAPDPSNLFTLFGLIPWNPSTLPLFGPFLMLGVFPIIMGATMWVQTNLNPPPADPVQQKIFGYMPILFTFMLANLPAGLVIYWAWNNFLSIIQQVAIMKSTGTPIDFIDRLRGMGRRLKSGEPAEKPAGPPD
jgi:YidC/Oxa1 family membrane protein insertase